MVDLCWVVVDIEDVEWAEGLDVRADNDGFAGELEEFGGEVGLAVDKDEGERFKLCRIDRCEHVEHGRESPTDAEDGAGLVGFAVAGFHGAEEAFAVDDFADESNGCWGREGWLFDGDC